MFALTGQLFRQVKLLFLDLDRKVLGLDVTVDKLLPVGVLQGAQPPA